MTLRELLKTAHLDSVYAIIHKRDSNNIAACDRSTLETITANYGHVVKELLSKPKVRAYSMPIMVDNAVDFLDDTRYIDVYFRNRKYVKPPKGKKPWDGVRGKKIPKGKYNCNLSKYNLRYSFMGVRWSKLIDTPVENKAGCSNEEMLANILWELTFDGWTEEKAAENTKKLNEKLRVAIKEIKSGKCITLPPKKVGGMKVVIPDSVNQQIMDIVNKPTINRTSKNKCGTCSGYGLWAIGDAAPMGPMDASDGLPTKACPECGANANPSK
jgi:hypothetical protein